MHKEQCDKRTGCKKNTLLNEQGAKRVLQRGHGAHVGCKECLVERLYQVKEKLVEMKWLRRTYIAKSSHIANIFCAKTD